MFQKFVLFPYYLKHLAAEDNFYSQALIARIQTGRIFSLFALPTLYAIICTVFLLFIFHYLLTSDNKKIKIYWGILFLLGIVNLILTQSFGGILYFSMGILIYLLLAGILKLKYLVPVLMVLSLFLFIIIALRFSEARELEPVKLRISNWNQAGRMIASAPFVGVGLGNYEANISYHTLSAEAKSIYAHNFFLQFIAETGFIIPCFLLLFLGVMRKKLLPCEYKGKIVYITVFLVVILYNAIDIGFYFFSAGLAAVVALSQVYPLEREKIPVRGNIKLILNIIGFAVICFLVAVGAISDSHRKTADFLNAQKDYEAARLYYEKSVKINPFNYSSLVNYADLSFRLDPNGNGEKYLDKALMLYPDLAPANYLKSHLEFKRSHLFTSYYYAAAAYNKNKLNQQYQQWFEVIKKNLESFIEKEAGKK